MFTLTSTAQTQVLSRLFLRVVGKLSVWPGMHHPNVGRELSDMKTRNVRLLQAVDIKVVHPKDKSNHSQLSAREEQEVCCCESATLTPRVAHRRRAKDPFSTLLNDWQSLVWRAAVVQTGRAIPTKIPINRHRSS